MKVTFTKHGKYKSGVSVVVVSEDDVKAGKVFNIFDSNAIEFIDAGSAEKYSEVKPPETDDFEEDMSKWTVKELTEFAAGHDPVIDLGDAKKKDDILAIITEAVKPPETND